MKAITPFKSKDTVTLNLKGNFSKVLIVKIDADFEVQGKLIDRKSLPKVKGDRLTLNWGTSKVEPREAVPLALLT